MVRYAFIIENYIILSTTWCTERLFLQQLLILSVNFCLIIYEEKNVLFGLGIFF